MFLDYVPSLPLQHPTPLTMFRVLSIVIVLKRALIKWWTWMVSAEAFVLGHLYGAGRVCECCGLHDGCPELIFNDPPSVTNFNTIFSLDCINESNK